MLPFIPTYLGSYYKEGIGGGGEAVKNSHV